MGGDVVLPNNYASGNMAIFNGGESPSASNVIDYIDSISSTGNAKDFGDLTVANANGGVMSSETRQVTNGDNTAGKDTYAIQYATKGNTSYFGDLTAQRWIGGVGGDKIKGINYSGYQSPGGPNNTIDFCIFASIGNFIDFGDANVASYFDGGCSDSTRTIKAGGIQTAPATYTDSIEYVTTQSTGNGADFGNLISAVAGPGLGMVCSSTRGVFGGGQPNTNVIQYVTIQSTGNATDFGDLTTARFAPGSACNSTRGVFAGGETPSQSNVIDYITIGSTGNATDFGDLTVARNYGQSASTSVRGVNAGGNDGSASNVIDYVTIASTGDAADFDDLTVARLQSFGGMSDTTRGVFGGGTNPDNVTIDYITIATTGNAADFGDMSVQTGDTNNISDSHGGLQG